MNDMTVAQPINGSRGATVAGPRNIPLEAQVPDIFAAPLTDHGSIPNLHFPFAFAHNRLEDGGWAREVTVREMPAMKASKITPPVATNTLLAGPATEVSTSLRTRCLKLRVFTGVGLAHPITGRWVNNAMGQISSTNTRNSMTIPLALSHFLPVGLKGMFAGGR